MIACADSFSSGRASQATAAGLSQFGNAAKTPALADSPADRRLRKAAAEFESILLSSLWKSMKTSFAGTDEESDDPGHDTLEGLGIEAISSAVAKAGGVGLGKLILKHLERRLLNSQNGNEASPIKVSPAPADSSH